MSEPLPALCLCTAEVVLATPQQVYDGAVYCRLCAPPGAEPSPLAYKARPARPTVCPLCAGPHRGRQCPKASTELIARRRPRHRGGR